MIEIKVKDGCVTVNIDLNDEIEDLTDVKNVLLGIINNLKGVM